MSQHLDEALFMSSDRDSSSAVDLFGDWDDGRSSSHDPGARYLRALPAEPPGPGAQYRFEVDLDRCSGCKACVSACHSLNGLDPGENWRSVGLVVGGGTGDAPVWQQHVTTACHHCLEPACLAGCPVDAYEKDPITGIVAHLDDQCIGCRYCMLTCPYEVPSFNQRLGVVRKCDMCTGRLSAGEAPACVQGCPTEAISIGVVETAELAALLAVDTDERVAPTAPRSALTSPTTVYLTRKPVPSEVVAADDHRVVPATNHPPLVAMLVLTQVSVGVVVLGVAMSSTTDWFGSTGRLGAGPALVAWLTTVVAIAACVMHLGRPTMAWRALLGLGHSWLSREILAFGVYATLGALTAVAAIGSLPAQVSVGAGVATSVAGLLGVFCSAQLYAVTGRSFWRLDRTLIRFVVTMAVTGAAVLTAVASLVVSLHTADWQLEPMRRAAVVVVLIGTVAGLAAVELHRRRHAGHGGELGRSEALLAGPLRSSRTSGVALAITACIAAVLSLLFQATSTASGAAWVLAAVAAIAASWIERRLFFVAVAPDRMPGGLR